MAALLMTLIGVHGQPTLHLQHEDGRVGVWKLDGILLQASLEYEPPRPPDGAVLVGAGDFDGDGASDLMFETKAGNLLVWHMDRETRSGSRELAPLASGERVALVDDWGSDGMADLLTRDDIGVVTVRSLDDRGQWRTIRAVAMIDDGW